MGEGGADIQATDVEVREEWGQRETLGVRDKHLGGKSFTKAGQRTQREREG